jgi:hypothetical protein
LVIIKTDLPRAPSIPLLDIFPSAWQPHADPDHVQHIARRALDYLALTRVWRAINTDAPPAGLIRTDRFTIAVLDQNGVDHQAFMDIAWRPGALLNFGMRSHPWQDARGKPRVIRFNSSREAERIAFPNQLPWIAGFSMPTHVVITAAGFSDGITVGHTSGPDGHAVIAIPRDKGIAVITSSGGDLSALVRNPVLKGFHLPVVNCEVRQRSLKYEVNWTDPSQHCIFNDRHGASAMLETEAKRLHAISNDLPSRMASEIGDAPPVTGDWSFDDPSTF